MAEKLRSRGKQGFAGADGTPGSQIVPIAVGSALTACALTLLAVHISRRAAQARPAAR